MSPWTDINYATVQHILHNDKEAFSQILERYDDQIYYHILKIVHNKEDARDLTNDAFAKAYLNLKLFKPKYKFNSWLYRIATNTAIDFLRKEKLRYDIQNPYNDKIQIANNTTPFTELQKKENYATLRDAVLKLRSEYRTIIKLRYYEELSYEEIAQRLNCPIGTVKATLYRAKTMLSKIITNQKNNGEINTHND